MTVTRETIALVVNDAGDYIETVVATETVTLPGDTDISGTTITFDDNLPDTKGQKYRYTATVRDTVDTGVADLEASTDMVLDTIAENPQAELDTMMNAIDQELIIGRAETGGTIFIDDNKNGILDANEGNVAEKKSFVVNAEGRWALTSSTVINDIKNDKDITTTEDADKAVPINFVDKVGNFIADGDVHQISKWYIFDKGDGVIATGHLSLLDEPEDATFVAGTDPNNWVKISDPNIEGGTDKYAITKFDETHDSDKYIFVKENMSSRTTVGFIAATGKGDDTFMVGGAMLKNTQVYLEEGDDLFSVKDVKQGTNVIDMGEGNDKVQVTGKFDWGVLYGGLGDDDVSIFGNLFQGKIDLELSEDANGNPAHIETLTHKNGSTSGDGNNELKVGGDILESSIISGSGDDLLRVAHNATNSWINLGGGNDTFDVGSYLQDSEVRLGEGNDTVTIGENIRNPKLNDVSIIDLDSGDDTLNVGWFSDNSTVITGGAGYDTLNLTADGSSRSLKETGMKGHDSSLTGIEEINLQGDYIELNLKYNEILEANDNPDDALVNGHILINSEGTGNKVDLGGSDWSSDTDTNLKDGRGRWSKVEDNTDVDGVSYDVYQHSSDSSGLHQVYIQDGIMII